MNYAKPILVLAFIICSHTSHAQETSIVTDSVLLKLTVTTLQGKQLQTEIDFQDISGKTIAKCFSNKEGKATCMLATGEDYKIVAPDADGNYEYDIPDIAKSPVSLTFTFDPKSK